MAKTNAPDGFYDAKLVSVSMRDLENRSYVMEMEYEISGGDYFLAKEGIFVVNAPSGDTETDANRKEWTKDAIKRVCEVFHEAVDANGNLAYMTLANRENGIADKIVRVKVTNDGKFSRAKVFVKKEKTNRAKVSVDDVKSMIAKNSRALASVGIVLGDSPAKNSGTASNGNDDVPF